MSNHRRLTTEQFTDKLRSVMDTISQEFVMPNPYVPQARVAQNEYSQVVEALFESEFDIIFTPYQASPAPQTPFAPLFIYTHTNPPPGAYNPTTPPGVRFSSNTLRNKRCRRTAYPPHTLCEVRWDYWKSHGYLPGGGAVRPGLPHPGNIWTGPGPSTHP